MTRKLDLGCGAHKPEGFEGADIAPLPGVDHVFDVLRFPWPFEDESFDELRSSHFVEHIPMAFWTPNPKFPIGHEITALAEGPHSISLFLKFFAEAWRVLKPGGSMRVMCPIASSDRAFQDPTHTRFLVDNTWNYLDHDWRKANGLQHAAYGAGALRCHFPITQRGVGASMDEAQLKALSLLADHPGSAADGTRRSVQDVAVLRYRNMVSDFDATLVKAPIPVDQPSSTATAQPAQAEVSATA